MAVYCFFRAEDLESLGAMAGRENSCALAYSKVQVECDVCPWRSLEQTKISRGRSTYFSHIYIDIMDILFFTHQCNLVPNLGR